MHEDVPPTTATNKAAEDSKYHHRGVERNFDERRLCNDIGGFARLGRLDDNYFSEYVGGRLGPSDSDPNSGVALWCCTLALHSNFAHGVALWICTVVSHSGVAVRRCTMVLHSGVALWFCTVASHVCFPLRVCIMVLWAGVALWLCMLTLRSGFALWFALWFCALVLHSGCCAMVLHSGSALWFYTPALHSDVGL